MIRRLARRFGLVTRRELEAAERKLGQMRQRLEDATQRIAKVTAASERLKIAKGEDAERHRTEIARLAAEYDRRTARLTEASNDASRRVAALEEQLRKRDLQVETTIREETALEQRIVAAVQEVDAARIYLKEIEVKLDILEGAANVLDHRLRAAGSTTDTVAPPRASGAASA